MARMPLIAAVIAALVLASPPALADTTTGHAVVAKAKKHKHQRHKKHRRHKKPRPVATATPANPSGVLPAPNAPAALGTCADASLAPTPSNLDRIRAATLCLVNQERAKVGAGALVEQPQLEAAASGQVADMLARDYYDHVSPDGKDPLDRDTAAGYLRGATQYAIGENLAWATGDASPLRIVAAWMDSPDHRDNLLSREYRDSGIAVAAAVPAFVASGPPAGLYAQEFGVRAG
jgi:uncharacterized protein YkwD